MLQQLKKLNILIGVGLFALSTTSQAAGDQWTKIYNATTNHPIPGYPTSDDGGPHSDFGQDVVIGSNGNFYITGGWNSTQFGAAWSRAEAYNFFIAKFDANGNGVWFQELDTGWNKDDKGIALSLDGANNAYVLGKTRGDISGEGLNPGGYMLPFIAKYDSDGNVQWIHMFGDLWYTPRDIVTTSDGTSFVLGDVYDTDAGKYNRMLRKYDSNGNKVWERIDKTSFNEQGVALALGPHYNDPTPDYDEFVYVVETTSNVNPVAYYNPVDIVVSKFSHIGSRHWTKTYPALGRDYPADMAYNPVSNQLVMVGYSSSYEIFTAVRENGKKYNFTVGLSLHNGEPLWTTRLSGCNGCTGLGKIAIDGSGNIHVTGSYGFNQTVEYGWGNAILYTKFNKDGQSLLVDHMGVQDTKDYGLGIAVDDAGNYLITGKVGGDLNGVPSDAAINESDMFITRNLP